MENIPNIPALLGVVIPPIVDRITEYPSVGIIPVTTIGGSYYLYKNGYGYFTIPVVLLGTTLTFTEFARSELEKRNATFKNSPKLSAKDFYRKLYADPFGYIEQLSMLGVFNFFDINYRWNLNSHPSSS